MLDETVRMEVEENVLVEEGMLLPSLLAHQEMLNQPAVCAAARSTGVEESKRFGGDAEPLDSGIKGNSVIPLPQRCRPYSSPLNQYSFQ